MTAVFALACDATVPNGVAPLPGWVWQPAQPCSAVSRPARTDEVLRVVAGRDGWLLDGARHLCPEHAAAASAAS